MGYFGFPHPMNRVRAVSYWSYANRFECDTKRHEQPESAFMRPPVLRPSRFDKRSSPIPWPGLPLTVDPGLGVYFHSLCIIPSNRRAA